MAATIRGAAASRHFTKALIDLAAHGLRTHCSDPETHHLWLSEDEQERAIAVELYPECPVQLECWLAANARNEKFGVWGGVDRTVRPKAAA
jgi:hypothetical protein